MARVKTNVLIVSSDMAAANVIKAILQGVFNSVMVAQTMTAAKQKLASAPFDVVVVNTPLPDESGVESLIELVGRNQRLNGMLLVKPDSYNQIAYRTEGAGIFILTKPVKKQVLLEAASMLNNMRIRIMMMEDENRRLRKKLDEVGIVTRAKCLLVEKRGMTEAQAHSYLEQMAMNESVSKKEICQRIIAQLADD